MPKLFLDRYYIFPDGTITTLDGRIMRTYDNNSMNVAWYKRIKLSSNGVRRAYYVHRLVAAMFIAGSLESMNGYDVDHIDGDTSNNNVTNLRIVSHGDNMRLMMSNNGRSNKAIVAYGKNFKRVRYV